MGGDDGVTRSASRRLSRNLKDLPVTHYWKRWCDCCSKKASYDQLEDDEEDHSKSQKNKKAQETLMAEQCLDATVNKIINNLSWVNATLLAAAMYNTLVLDFPNIGDDYAKANNAWIYFFVIFSIGIILAVIPRVFEDLEEMKRELALQGVENKIIMGMKAAVAAKEKKIETKKANSTTAKLHNFVEAATNEGGELVEKFEDLFVATLSNTVSMAWRDAAKATFALTTSSSSATATAYFFYALFMTTFGAYLVIRIGGVYEKKAKAIIHYLETFDPRFNTAGEEKKQLLKFAFVKRSIKLTQTVIKFAIAWSWRDSINAFIHAIYGDDGGDVVAQ